MPSEPIPINDTALLQRYNEVLQPHSVAHLWQEFFTLPALPELQLSFENAAVASSQIEGSKVDLDYYFRFRDVGNIPADMKRDIRHTDDLVRAYQFASINSLSEKNALTTHALLSQNFLPTSRQGTYRKERMFIRNPLTGEIVYAAIEPEFVREAMQQFWDDLDMLLRASLPIDAVFYHAALLHVVFENIHPFADGNGRTGRLLEKWFLVHHLGEKAWRIPSERYYQQHYDAYFKNINRIGQNYYLMEYANSLPFLTMLPKGLVLFLENVNN
jgi:Fic family protein